MYTFVQFWETLRRLKSGTRFLTLCNTWHRNGKNGPSCKLRSGQLAALEL